MIKKILILMLGCVIFSIVTITKTITKKFFKHKKSNYYHTPRLSELKGKDFANYIEHLRSGLY